MTAPIYRFAPVKPNRITLALVDLEAAKRALLELSLEPMSDAARNTHAQALGRVAGAIRSLEDER